MKRIDVKKIRFNYDPGIKSITFRWDPSIFTLQTKDSLLLKQETLCKYHMQNTKLIYSLLPGKFGVAKFVCLFSLK